MYCVGVLPKNKEEFKFQKSRIILRAVPRVCIT